MGDSTIPTSRLAAGVTPADGIASPLLVSPLPLPAAGAGMDDRMHLVVINPRLLLLGPWIQLKTTVTVTLDPVVSV